MKKISLLAVLLMLVLLVSVPAFAAEEAKAPAGPKPGEAFSFQYGVFIPTQGHGTPIQLTGGDEPAKSSLGGK